jgi:L,D-transpeptidase YnhG
VNRTDSLGVRSLSRLRGLFNLRSKSGVASLAAALALITAAASLAPASVKQLVTPLHDKIELREAIPTPSRSSTQLPMPGLDYLRTSTVGSDPESRLVEVQHMLAQGRHDEALVSIQRLIQDVPNFRAAHLLYGDLLSSKAQNLDQLGAVPNDLANLAQVALAGLREESKIRISAIQDVPAAGLIPSQFLTLSSQVRHAIAVDASKSRLYLFENAPNGLKLLASYYVSVGKYGIGKAVEGDQRTPLGVYFISRTLAPKDLPTVYGKGFYGDAALTLNYPNPLDIKRGKTGGGIWLHGTPPTEFARVPRASDGCVVLSNENLAKITKTAATKTTPVVIAESIHWVSPSVAKSALKDFSNVLQGWEEARSAGDPGKLLVYYDQAVSGNKPSPDGATPVGAGIKKVSTNRNEIYNLSILKWSDSEETMVVTFVESVDGALQGQLKRHYWTRKGSQWKIFYEGLVG